MAHFPLLKTAVHVYRTLFKVGITTASCRHPIRIPPEESSRLGLPAKSIIPNKERPRTWVDQANLVLRGQVALPPASIRMLMLQQKLAGLMLS